MRRLKRCYSYFKSQPVLGVILVFVLATYRGDGHPVERYGARCTDVARDDSHWRPFTPGALRHAAWHRGWLVLPRLRGGEDRLFDQEIKMQESHRKRNERLERGRAEARARPATWQDTLRRTWRSIKKVIWGRARLPPRATPPPFEPRAWSRELNAGTHRNGNLSNAGGAWDWKQATKDLRRQRELEMLKVKRMGPVARLRREDFESNARPLAQSMSILSPHVDGRLKAAIGCSPEDIVDALSEEEKEELEEIQAATEAHVSSDAHVEISVPEAELADIALDLPVMALLVPRSAPRHISCKQISESES